MTKRLKVALLYGGNNSEHEVSLASAAAVLKHLDPQSYEVFPIALDKQGIPHLHQEQDLRALNQALPVMTDKSKKLSSLILDSQFCLPVDVVLPIMHGTFYEDGCLQGLLRLANIAFVGCDVLSSALGMDKDIARQIACDEYIECAQYTSIHKKMSDNEWAYIVDHAINQFGWPLFIKPCSSGSSVGIHKAQNRQQVFDAIQDALRFDEEVLIEQCIVGREIEVSVLEDLKNRQVICSLPGEIRVNHKDGFYSYDAKYINSQSSEYLIPAPLTPEWSDKIRQAALHVFKKLKCRGLARVDFFYDENNQKLYFNEINTMPGFTSISLYPSMWKKSGINFNELLALLIETAILQQEIRQNLITNYKA